MGGQHHPLADLPRGKDPVPIVQEAGWGQSGRVQKISKCIPWRCKIFSGKIYNHFAAAQLHAATVSQKLSAFHTCDFGLLPLSRQELPSFELLHSQHYLLHINQEECSFRVACTCIISYY
jgi:hypothetical protein